MSKNRKSLAIRIVFVFAVEGMFMWGLWKGIAIQMRRVNESVGEISSLIDPSPFRGALLGHLGKINVGMRGYLRSPDPALVKQVSESRKDFLDSLPEFQRQNPGLFPKSAAEEIRTSFDLYKDAVDHTLEAHDKRMQCRNELDQNFARILYLIDHELRPLIHKGQADGEERGEAVLNLENQVRAWQQNLSQAWAQPSAAAKSATFDNENRGEIFLENFGAMELKPRERKVQKEMRTLWRANADRARESFARETVVSQSESTMVGDHEAVVATLNRLLPPMPPSQLEARKISILNQMHLQMAAAGALGLIGLASFLLVVLTCYRWLSRPEAPADGVFNAPAAAVSSAPHHREPTLQMNMKGAITVWTPSASSLYGYSADEMHGQSIGSLFESESEIGRLYSALKGSKGTAFETIHKTKAGAPIHVRIEFEPVSEGGRVRSIGLICTRF